MLFFILISEIKKREAITYLSYSTCKQYLHVQLLFSLAFYVV